MKIETKIVSAFPGMGKTYFFNDNENISIDSDSSNFSWVKDEDGNNTDVRNPDFPSNYIEHIKDNIGRYQYIFVSSHKEIRDALTKEGIAFTLIYPKRERKTEFLERYANRGNDEKFISLFDNKWDFFIDSCEIEKNNKYCTLIEYDKNLSDVLNE